MILTEQREGEYRRLLRRLRQDPRLWEGERMGAMIDKVKRHCAPTWDARRERHVAEAGARWMRLWE